MREIKQTSHGYHGTKIYKLWATMVARCGSKSSTNYKYYGGRGITVCEDWRNNPKSFIEWALSNGYEEGLEIDRIDNSKGYEPSNCQFITHAENSATGKRGIRVDNKSGERNIVITRFGTYEVYAQVNGKQKYIGSFKTKEDAKEARDKTEGNIHDKEVEE